MKRSGKKHLAILSGTIAPLSVLLFTRTSHAYGWDTHKEIVRQASEAMRLATVIPDPVARGPEWQTYLSVLTQTYARLGLLRSGLRDPFVMHSGPHSTCAYDLRDNLALIDRVQLQDLAYLPRRIDRSEDPDPCELAPVSTDIRGDVLGWHASTVDDRLDDSVVWYRPTNAVFASTVKRYASFIVESGIGALALPFVCFANAVFGDGCDIDDSFDLAAKYNPVTLIESWLPGFGNTRSDTYTGVWHHIAVHDDGGEFNDTRGLLYERAGHTHPGALDVAIMALTSASGLSLNAYESDGDNRYGQYDRVVRLEPAWQAFGLGHTEFSPLDNLAKYGWDKFLNDPTDAEHLAWPLHALGDAAEPHHVVATTAWGHRPYEDYVERNYEKIVPFNDSQILRILLRGFEYWSGFRATDDIQGLVTDLAVATRDRVENAGNWPYNDGASTDYAGGSELGLDDVFGSQLKEDAIASYAEFEVQMRPLLEEGIGATVALLARAGELVQDPGFEPATQCATGSHFDFSSGSCTVGAPPPPSTVTKPIPLEVCFADSLGCYGTPPDGGTGGSGGTGSGSCGPRDPCATNDDCLPSQVCFVGCCSPSPS